MLFLLLAILSSALIAIFMRLSTRRISANLSMLAVNYLMCAVLGAGYTGFRPAGPGEAGFFPMVRWALSQAVFIWGDLCCASTIPGKTALF